MPAPTATSSRTTNWSTSYAAPVKRSTESLKWKKEAGYLRRELRRLTGLDNIIGQSAKMRAIFDLIQTDRAANQPRPDHRRKRHR